MSTTITMAVGLNVPLSYLCRPAHEIALKHPESLRVRLPVPLYPCPNLAIVKRPQTQTTMTHIFHVNIRASMQTSPVRDLQPRHPLPNGRRTTTTSPPPPHFHSASRSPCRTPALSHATTSHPNAPSWRTSVPVSHLHLPELVRLPPPFQPPSLPFSYTLFCSKKFFWSM